MHGTFVLPPLGEIPPFAPFTYVEGVSFLELKRTGNAQAIAQFAYAVGQTLAVIERFTFPKSGWISPGLTVTDFRLSLADPIPNYLDLCLTSRNLQERLSSQLRSRTSETATRSIERPKAFSPRRL